MASVSSTDPQYLIARYNFIRGVEKYVPYLYLDNRGFLTTGMGFLLERGYVTPAEKSAQSILQTQTLNDIRTTIGGFDSAQQRVVDIVQQATQAMQTENPNYTFSQSQTLTTFLGTPFGQKLNADLEIHWSTQYSTFLITGVKEANGTVTPVPPVFSNEGQNAQVIAKIDSKYERPINDAINTYGLDLTVEQRVGLFSISWNRPASVDTVANALASGVNDQSLLNAISLNRSAADPTGTHRFPGERSLLRGDGSVVPGYDPVTHQYRSLIPNFSAGTSSPIVNYPDIAGFGGTVVFADGSQLVYGANQKVSFDGDLANQVGGKFATVREVLDPQQGIQIEYRIDSQGQSAGGQLVLFADDPATRLVYSFTNSSQIKVAPGGGAFLFNDGVSAVYVNIASGDTARDRLAGRVSLIFDPVSGAGNLTRQNTLGPSGTVDRLPPGSRYDMKADGTLIISLPDQTAIKIAAPGLAPLPGSVPPGYQVISEPAPGLFVGRSSSGNGARLLYTADTGDGGKILAYIPEGAKFDLFKTNVTDRYPTVVVVTDPASGACYDPR